MCRSSPQYPRCLSYDAHSRLQYCMSDFTGSRRYYGVSLFFFFQAEDGIRDYKVTGVQTCALPIFRGRVVDVLGQRFRARAEIRVVVCEIGLLADHADLQIAGAPALADARVEHRSEERRVGKECRSRWSPYH